MHNRYPCLVVDNSGGDRSSADNDTPRVFASRNIGKCHRPGIDPLARHIETLDFFTSRRPAKAPVPPKRSTTADAEIPSLLSMMTERISQVVENVKPKNSQGVVFAGSGVNDSGATLRQTSAMRKKDKVWRYDGKEALSRAEGLLRKNHDIDLDVHGMKQRAAAFFGASPTQYGNWRKRGLPIKETVVVAQALNADVYYILGQTNETGCFGLPPDDSNERIAKLEALVNEAIQRLRELEEGPHVRANP